MPRDGTFLVDENGERTWYPYDEMDAELLPALWKPAVGFVYDANVFTHLELPDVPFYLKDWLPKHGKMEVYAPPKSGKSFFAVQLAQSIGAGKMFLGMPTTQGRVLYIQSELGLSVLQDRMKSTGQDYDNVYVGTSFSLKLDTDHGQKRIEEIMKVVLPDVVIFDPLYKMLTGDENAATDMRTITDYIDDVLIEAFKASVVIIHHPGKDVSRGGRGSSLIDDWVDSLIEMRRTSKPSEPLTSKLTPKLLRHATAGLEPIELVLQGGEFTIGEPEQTLYDVLAEFIKEKGRIVTRAEVFSLGVGSQNTIYAALHQLQDNGKISWERGNFLWIGEE